MGIKLNKFEPDTMGDGFPFRIVNANKSGMCYLCIHDHGSLTEKLNHHSLFIDVAGESRIDAVGVPEQVVGLMLHVIAKSTTGETRYRSGRAKTSTKYNVIYSVGQLPNIKNLSPNKWASQLRDIGDSIYIDLVEGNNCCELWNSQLNCHVFVQKLIQELNLQYPLCVCCCTDIPPIIVNLSMICMRQSANSKIKSGKADPNTDDEDSDSTTN